MSEDGRTAHFEGIRIGIIDDEHAHIVGFVVLGDGEGGGTSRGSAANDYD